MNEKYIFNIYSIATKKWIPKLVKALDRLGYSDIQ